MTNLFRDEAVNHAAKRLEGEVLLGTSTSWSVMGYGLTLVVVAGLAFMSIATYARTEAVTGWLVPKAGIIRMSARNGGVLQALDVQEGDAIHPGQLLAQIRLSTDTSNGDAGKALADSAQSQLHATNRAARAQIDKLQADRTQLLGQQEALNAQHDEAVKSVGILTAKLGLAQANAGRGEELFKKGYLSQQALDGANGAVFSAQQDVSSARSTVLAFEQQLDQIRSQIATSPILVAQAKSQGLADQAVLDQKVEQISANNEYALTSPVQGKVTAIPMEVGQTVAAGNTVLVVTPSNSPLQAELFVPSRAAGFIKVGQDVALQYQAFPYEKFGSANGKIISVSRTVLAPGDVTLSGMSLQEPVFRVRVALDRDFVSAYGGKTPLQPGMLLNADVVIDRRSLLEWLLDPLYAVGKRV